MSKNPTRVVRIHQPLWGGFPMHWAAKTDELKRTDARRRSWWILTNNESKASRFTIEEAMEIEGELRDKYPSAVIAIY